MHTYSALFLCSRPPSRDSLNWGQCASGGPHQNLVLLPLTLSTENDVISGVIHMLFLLEKCSSLRCDSPSTPGSKFGVEMHKTWADGKPLHGTDGKAPKIKVPMANAEYERTLWTKLFSALLPENLDVSTKFFVCCYLI